MNIIIVALVDYAIDDKYHPYYTDNVYVGTKERDAFEKLQNWNKDKAIEIIRKYQFW